MGKTNMALQSASTTIKLFSVARGPLVSNLAAGTSIAAKTADQKRNASGGNYVYINPIKENPSWGEAIEASARTLFLTEIVRGFAVTLGQMFKEPATINYPFEKAHCHPDLEENMPYEDMRLERKDVLHVNYVKPFVRLKQYLSKQTSAPMEPDELLG